MKKGKKQLVIRAEILFDGKTALTDKCVIIKDNYIIDVSSYPRMMAPDYEGIVTPAFIDAHSHIGMVREGEPASEEEGNDNLNQISPSNDPVNSIYFDDTAFKDAVDFGVLYSCVVPGSGNLIGGKAKIIRNFAENRSNAVLKDYGYKMALGYNPRSTTGWKGDRPNTRMGTCALLEEKIEEVFLKEAEMILDKEKALRELYKKYKESDKEKFSGQELIYEQELIDKKFDLKLSSKEKAILGILKGQGIVKVHLHKEDDALYLIQLIRKYPLMRVTADHCAAIFNEEIFNELARNNIPVVYGPLGALAYKTELRRDHYQNTAVLMKSSAFYGLMSDHPVILAASLRESLKFFLIFGMGEEEAISIITYKNAKILKIDDILGSIEIGKLASLIVWNKIPLHLGAFPTLVLGEGKILRKQ